MNMRLLKKILFIILNLPIIIVALAIVKLPILNQYKLHLLSTWHDFEKRSKLDNFLSRVFFTVWFKFEYLKEANPDERENLKFLAMGEQSGRKWAECYQNKPFTLTQKIGHMTFKEASPIFDETSTILSDRGSKFSVIQIGSSSGREMRYFADMFPEHEFIGTDIDDEIIEYSSHYHKQRSNLSFLKLTAKEIGNLLDDRQTDRQTDRQILIFSSGSLQYVQPEHLIIFFNSLARHKNLKVLIFEPGNESKGSPNELSGSIWRGNFSYTHNYKWYAERSGIETLKCKIIRPYYPYDDFPMHQDAIHYFYYGKTGN